MDETRVHHFTPETKEQSKQWTEKGESAPKKGKTVPSAGKVMASFITQAHKKKVERTLHVKMLPLCILSR